MVRLIEISKSELKNYVWLAYKGDMELLSKYHIKDFTLDEAIDSTLEMIDVSEKKLRLTYFKVLLNDYSIGYVVTSGNHLYSFAIAMEYRTKEILNQWWYKVKSLLGEKFTCLLFSNNKRAINYLEKRGMKIEWENPEEKELKEVLLTY